MRNLIASLLMLGAIALGAQAAVQPKLFVAQAPDQMPRPQLEVDPSLTAPPPPPPMDAPPIDAPPSTSVPPAPPPDQGPKSGLAEIVNEVRGLLEPFIYDPKGQRDPFRPFVEIKLTSDEEQVPVLPLQRFELEQLKLIGIIWDVEEPKAMFLDPNSEVYVIGKDERIGRRNGYIATIREGEVVIVEASKVRGEVVYTSKIVRIAR